MHISVSTNCHLAGVKGSLSSHSVCELSFVCFLSYKGQWEFAQLSRNQPYLACHHHSRLLIYVIYIRFSHGSILVFHACNNTLLNCANPDPLTVTDHLPCQHRVVHFLCTPPIRRTGSIPSCVCVCAGPPRGLDQSVGTSPDPLRWDSAPSRPSPARQTGAPREPRLCICLSNTNPSFGPPFKEHWSPKRSKN